MVIGVAACALFGGFVKLLVLDWSRRRPSTMVLSVTLASILGFGSVSAVGPRRSRRRVAAVAVVFVVAVVVWLGYVVTYCSCRLLTRS
jgi:drug/metabolite transporter superfamily protein YnfA